MRHDLSDQFEDIQKNIQEGRATKDDIQWMIDKIDAYVNSYTYIADLAKRNAKDHAFFRDYLKDHLKEIINVNK